MRSFISDCYSFCRFSVLAPEAPPGGEQVTQHAGDGGEAQQHEQEQRQADDFVAAVLGDGAAGPADDESPSSAPQPQAAVAAAAAGEAGASSRPATGEDGVAGSPEAPSCTAVAAIWALHPCPRASAEEPPALLALPGGDERTAALVCCACGASLASFQEEAAGRKLGMLMAVQLYCLPPAAAAAAAAASSTKPTTAAAAASPPPPPRVCLAAGYEDGSLVLWDAATPGAPLAQRQLCKEPIMALALHPCPCGPTGGACGSAEESVVVFKLDHSACPPKVGIRHEIELRKQGIGDAVVRPDGKLLATGGWDGRVRIYKYRSGRALAILKVGGCRVVSGWWQAGVRNGWRAAAVQDTPGLHGAAQCTSLMRALAVPSSTAVPHLPGDRPALCAAQHAAGHGGAGRHARPLAAVPAGSAGPLRRGAVCCCCIHVLEACV